MQRTEHDVGQELAALRHALEDASWLRSCFGAAYYASRETLDVLQVGADTILRRDIVTALARLLGRDLSGLELSAALRAFALDAGATVSWEEFEKSADVLRRLCTPAPATAPARSTGSCQRQLGGTAARGTPAEPLLVPRSTGHEVGFAHGLTPVLPKEPCQDAATRFVPLRQTDVTVGGEGRTLTSYFGSGLA